MPDFAGCGPRNWSSHSSEDKIACSLRKPSCTTDLKCATAAALPTPSSSRSVQNTVYLATALRGTPKLSRASCTAVASLPTCFSRRSIETGHRAVLFLGEQASGIGEEHAIPRDLACREFGHWRCANSTETRCRFDTTQRPAANATVHSQDSLQAVRRMNRPRKNVHPSLSELFDASAACSGLLTEARRRPPHRGHALEPKNLVVDTSCRKKGFLQSVLRQLVAHCCDSVSQNTTAHGGVLRLNTKFSSSTHLLS